LPACLLGDPPEERLIELAEFPFWEEVARAATGGGFPTRETLIDGGLQQFGSPKTYVEDAQELEVALVNRFAAIWALLWDFSWESRGLDLNELFEAAIATREDE
jgi:hypothetical protein